MAWYIDGSAFHDEGHDRIGIYTDDAQAEIICDVLAEDVGRERCVQHANLIAAAPLLLAACRNVVSAFAGDVRHVDPAFRPVFEQARAAIDKAESQE